jgi:hypothetical protein
VVEQKRSAAIPDWAYRDVLFMLIHYSVASFELLERKLSPAEKEEVYDVFKRVGERMGVKEVPATYNQWLISHQLHLDNDLERSSYTTDLFKQYRKHLGAFRYFILLEAQTLVVPAQVKRLLGFGKFSWISFLIPVYKILKKLKLDWYGVAWMLPEQYKKQIKALAQ